MDKIKADAAEKGDLGLVAEVIITPAELYIRYLWGSKRL